MCPSRNYLRWNSISPVSVVSHPAPNSTLQGSKLHRLSVIVNLSTCMPESLRVWAVCDCTSFAFLTIVRLAIELFYCCCMGDMRFTIYTRLSIQSNNNYPPRQRMCVCIWYLPTRNRLHVYDYDKCTCNTLNTSIRNTNYPQWNIELLTRTIHL